jgi:hypothetical protein
MAGPRLSPGAFQIGLQHASFPNPDTPIYAGHVGFFGGSHAMTVDAAEWWYDASAPSPYAQEGDGAGAMCYVNHGARHGITDWDPQAPDELFGPSCDSGG